MTPTSIQDFLALVERPSRYLGTEINAVKKDPSGIGMKFALAFPDLYEIGTSHFGIQILYQILNKHPRIAAERVFAPAEDMETLLRKNAVPLMSLESRTPLKDFNILGFSLLYELNYTNILTMLDLSGIPFLSKERDDSFPLVIGGGPCTCNPEPLADFFDAFVVGDGEEVVLEMAETWFNLRRNGDDDKASVLKAWSTITGVYIPARFPVTYDRGGFQLPVGDPGTGGNRPGIVERAVLADLDKAAFPLAPILPFGKPVHDRLRLEVSRGCTRGCRFCQAGMIYRPVRERSEDTLMAVSRASLEKTGYEDLSLLSLSTGDYSCIGSLMTALMGNFESTHTAVSLPSLRAGTLTPELMRQIKKVRKTGFTIAPEAGSQRLRNVINKNISREEIFETVRNAFGLGWQVIKLYFMIGLPTETWEDLQEMVDLVDALRKIRGAHGHRGKINVSVTTFIPKPHTPFQWFSQISLEESISKIKWLRTQLKKPGVHFKWQSPEVSFLEGVWARGDRRLSRLLVTAYAKGCRFDGWSDRFDFRVWQEAFAEAGVDVPFFTTRKRDVDEPLPWDHIGMKVSKTFLAKEWQSALDERKTDDCRWHPCNECGVCDFTTIKPELFRVCNMSSSPSSQPVGKDPGFYKAFAVTYAKTGQAKYFGHLELVNIIVRALRRAGVSLKYSQGFHPMPKISFDDPLPVGMESVEERFYITVTAQIDAGDLLSRLNRELPEGIEIKRCLPVKGRRKRSSTVEEAYFIGLKEGRFDPERLNRFLKLPEYGYVRTNRKGRRRDIDLKKVVVHMELKNPQSMYLNLLKESGRALRPQEILREIFDLSGDELKTATIIKGLNKDV
ncbi:MAG: TIGR03960 family B12-binding radical SAM protein [Deltaproteobacteria bacterium]|nr:TIGR03960 family B12-binding radical SAM protein [Deltaproteobacteria bacterium]